MRPLGRIRSAALAFTATTGAVVLLAAPVWACVAGVAMALERNVVAPGSEIEVTVTPVAGPRPPPLAIRLDTVDGPPLVRLVPPGDGPAVVRVVIPAGITPGQHVLVANNDPHPRPAGSYGYLPTSALFTVVAPEVAARKPVLHTVFELRPAVPFDELADRLRGMGADVVQLTYTGAAAGTVENTGNLPISSALAGFQADISTRHPAARPVLVEQLTLKGLVEAVSFGPLTGRVATRNVVDLSPPSPESRATTAVVDGTSSRWAAITGGVVALVAAGTAVVVGATRRRRPG